MQSSTFTRPHNPTPTQRVQALRQRRADLGLTRLDLYAHPDDHGYIKTYAQALTDKRAKKTTKPIDVGPPRV